MSATDGDEPTDFFRALQHAFAETMGAGRAHPDFVKGVAAQAFDTFDGNVAIQSEGLPGLACQKGCVACCALRVAATAPEILIVAQYVRATTHAFAKLGIDLERRVQEEAAATNGLNESERLALRRPCAFIEDGICLIYRVRPLACRGHASYDAQACAASVEGLERETPISIPHYLVRGVVQNALLSALRDSGLAWGLYEFNTALRQALADPDAEALWINGGDPFVSATVTEVDASDMAKTFDAINSR